jgi:hypothetical protein
MTDAFTYRRQRWLLVLALALVVVAAIWVGKGAIDDSEERRQRAVAAAEDRRRIENLAVKVAAQQETLLSVAKAIEDATSPAAQARGAAATGRAVNDLRRSIDCVALYFHDERPPACEDVAGRLDRIRAGEDPFALPSAPPAPSTGEDA